ncbi:MULTISPECIES: transketolase-like TK C-terminal-containing protein [Gammaproteobacteria]|uniref:transketolase-like TK C-terminal-containing protein n=1 Tax=Gammaproteobacteria TaxID=1236 RepID=UPI001866C9B8|nr:MULTISPECIES: pyruvate dehydrogenase (lipoamide) [Gammaproteobacteria]
MSVQYFKMPATSEKTSQAALTCVPHIQSMIQNSVSDPLLIYHWIEKLSHKLNQEGLSREVLSTQKQSPTAWPIWFLNNNEYEKPLFYFFSDPSVAMLGALQTETNRKGIFINRADVQGAPLPKGVQAWFPLALTGMDSWLPYDPANIQEAGAIIEHAIQTLYVEGKKQMVYIATHEAPCISNGVLDQREAENAYLGMHCVAKLPIKNDGLIVRLCGAGKALSRTLEAAYLLKKHWKIDSEVWSCPSYTKLAFDAEQLNYQQASQHSKLVKSHLEQCIGSESWPVVAITDYTHLIASQIKPFISSPFAAIGNDSQIKGKIHYPQAEWIALCALKLLVDDQKLPTVVLEDALNIFNLDKDK